MALAFAILLAASHGLGMRTKIERFENWVDCEALTSYEQCDGLTQTKCPTECADLAKPVPDQVLGASQQENLGAPEPLALGEALEEALGIARALPRAKKKDEVKTKKKEKFVRDTFKQDKRNELKPRPASVQAAVAPPPVHTIWKAKALKRQRMRRINDLEERLASARALAPVQERLVEKQAEDDQRNRQKFGSAQEKQRQGKKKQRKVEERTAAANHAAADKPEAADMSSSKRRLPTPPVESAPPPASAMPAPADDDFDYGTSGIIVQLKSTGFGFIKPDTSDDDNHNLYFHASGVAGGAFKSLRTGDRMKYEIDIDERLNMAFAKHVIFDYGSSGTIVQLKKNGLVQYGFIKPDTSNDYNHNLYFSVSGVAGGISFNSFRTGERVKYEVGLNDRRNQTIAKQVSFDYGTSGTIVQLKSPGFGFIKPDTSDDDNHNLYFHASGVAGGTLFDFGSFRTRDRVKYVVGVDKRRNKAIAIQVKFEAMPKSRPRQSGSRSGRGRGRDDSQGRSGGQGPMKGGALMMGTGNPPINSLMIKMMQQKGAPHERRKGRVAPSPRRMQMIDEKLYRAIAKIKPNLAGKVMEGGVAVLAKLTRMMLELDNSDPLMLLESEEQLKHRIDEALLFLGAK